MTDRGEIISEVFTAFGKQPKDEFIYAAERITHTLTSAQLASSVKYLVNQDNFPNNVGYAIKKVAYQQMPAGSTYNHPEGSVDPEMCAEYAKLLIFTISKKLSKDIYEHFWKFIGEMWEKAVDEFERKNNKTMMEEVIFNGYKALEIY